MLIPGLVDSISSSSESVPNSFKNLLRFSYQIMADINIQCLYTLNTQARFPAPVADLSADLLESRRFLEQNSEKVIKSMLLVL